MRRSVLVAVLLTLACSTQQHVVKTDKVNTKERGLYEHGLKALSRNDFKGAQKSFSELLRQYPATPYLSGAFYNLGLALEGLSDFKGAETKYRKVVDINEGTSPSKDSDEALYRLSLCYEVLGNDEKLTFTLLQILDHAHFLPEGVMNMEVPARLAGSYARQGNLDQAKKYFKQAEGELRKYTRPPLSGDVLTWLPKTLYSMGAMHTLKKNPSSKDYEDYLSGLGETQEWLLKAAELNSTPWSQRAAESLEDDYLSALTAIRDLTGGESPDPLVAAKRHQETQKKMAGQLDQVLAKLKTQRLPASPEEPEPKPVKELFKTVGKVETRVGEILSARDVRDQNTPEAEALQGIKR